MSSPRSNNKNCAKLIPSRKPGRNVEESSTSQKERISKERANERKQAIKSLNTLFLTYPISCRTLGANGVRFKVRGLCSRRQFALTKRMHSNKDELLLTRLNHHPHLRERIETLLNIVDNVAGECTKADAAEQAVIEEVRKLGNVVLQEWADQAVQTAEATVRQQQPVLQGNGGKKSGGIRCSG